MGNDCQRDGIHKNIRRNDKIRYALADEGQASYKIEETAYTKEDDPDKYLGYLEEDIDFTGGQNPHEPQNSGGTRRAPHNYSPETKEYAFSIPVLPYDDNTPLEIAMGERTVEDIMDHDSVKVGERTIFSEADQLPTATIQHDQKDLDLIEWFIGTKASMTFEANIGEAVQITLDCLAAKHDYDDNPSSHYDLNIPNDKPLFRFWMHEGITYDGDPFLAVAGVSHTVENGLEALYHGEEKRDAYAIAESTSTDKYDTTITAKIMDLDQYKAAVENEVRIDIEMPFVRGKSDDGTINDAIILKLDDCKILTADIPFQGEGHLEHDIEVAPLESSIEILTPV